ncbi:MULTISPECIES: DivIVA domain-containing protein [unclassified Micromonospora]|uniref:DivIVA domain-containing protein n=1 Tax=unclassified Micromonospora TaxID=2617518 RepID=UPI002FF15F31
MSIDHSDRIALPGLPDQGELARQLSMLEARRFRGSHWLSADEVSVVIRTADDRIALLVNELERQRRENHGLLSQVEMLRHGTLPSNAPQGPDPMAVELAMRAQDEANRTIGEASAEGAEIIADARRQADEILAEAHRRAGDLSSAGPVVPALPPAGGPSPEVQRRLQELEERHAAALAAVAAAQQQLDRWQAYLSAQSEQLRADAAAAGGTSAQLRALLGG